MTCGMIFGDRKGLDQREDERKKRWGACEKCYEIQTRLSDYEKQRKKEKTGGKYSKCSLAALTDRPIILRAHLEAMPG